MTKLQDIILRDTRANQPAAGTAGRLYYVTDENVTERDSGSAWEDVSDAGGGGGGATILARYTRTTTQAISNNTSTIVDYATSVRDTDSAVTTGGSWHFTAPSTLDYTVLAGMIFDTTNTWNDGEIATLELWKNGSAYSTLDWKDSNGGAGYVRLGGSDTVRCTAGDTLAIHVLQLSGGSLNLLNSGQYNFVSISSLP